METLLIILVPGIAGGLVLALLIAFVPGRGKRLVVPHDLAAPSPALINMASIRVEGIGGLGMVAAVMLVAASQPHIRFATILSVLLGVGLALVLIRLRRGTGAMPSSGGGPGDRSVLHLDDSRRNGVERSGSDRPQSLVQWHALPAVIATFLAPAHAFSRTPESRRHDGTAPALPR